MQEYKLSITIPSYNRKEFLKETLESVLQQIREDVQIVVSDNCSSDGTEELMQEYCNKYEFITYYRHPVTVEADINIRNAVALASGEYCWLLTDDDCLEVNALEVVMPYLYRTPLLTGISVNQSAYDYSMTLRKAARRPIYAKETTLFTDAHSCFKVIGAWLAYISAQIVNRKFWEESLIQGGHEPYIGYYHYYIIGQMIVSHPRWLYISDRLVKYRSENETFSREHGLYRRYEIDVVTYIAISSTFFGKQHPVVKDVGRAVLSTYLLGQLIGFKLKNPSPGLSFFWSVFKLTFEQFKFYGFFWLQIFPCFCMPRCMLIGMKKCYRIFFREKKMAADLGFRML